MYYHIRRDPDLREFRYAVGVAKSLEGARHNARYGTLFCNKRYANSLWKARRLAKHMIKKYKRGEYIIGPIEEGEIE